MHTLEHTGHQLPNNEWDVHELRFFEMREGVAYEARLYRNEEPVANLEDMGRGGAPLLTFFAGREHREAWWDFVRDSDFGNEEALITVLVNEAELDLLAPSQREDLRGHFIEFDRDILNQGGWSPGFRLTIAGSIDLQPYIDAYEATKAEQGSGGPGTQDDELDTLLTLEGS